MQKQNLSRARRGFTLIELLVVIAITSILLTLVFKPLVDSYNLTSRASTQIEGQTAARETMRQINTTLSNAVFVFDNASTPINLWFSDKNGAGFFRRSPYSMIEYVAPARQLDQHPGQTPIDPTTGQPIYDNPNITSAQSGFALPLAPGRTLGRLFIGLRDNRSGKDGHPANNEPDDGPTNGMPIDSNGKFHGYANHYEDFNTVSDAQDNRYTLYRAEVLTYIPDPTKPNDATAPFVPNLMLFHTRAANGVLGNDPKNPVELHDPNFFYDNSDAGTNGDPKVWAVPGWRDINKDGKVQIWENWAAVSASLMPLKKVDMIALDRDENNNNILFDANGRPSVRTLTSFTPGFVQNDPGTPTGLESAGNEEAAAFQPTPNQPTPPDSPRVGSGFTPATYSAQYTHWSTPYRVIVYRNNDAANPSRDPLNPVAPTKLEYYQSIGDGRIFHFQVNPGDPAPEPNAGTPDVGPQINVNTGAFQNRNCELAFAVDPTRGLVTFSFPQTVLVRDVNNLPMAQRYSPADVNARLDPDAAGNVGQYQKRYLNLGDTLPTALWGTVALNAPEANSISPLKQFATPAGSVLPKVRIVPGSERIFGPDQRPGTHYGFRIQYTRVSANVGEIGPNQYKINYEDINNAQNAADVNDPRVKVGYIEFNSTWDAASRPNSLDDIATGFVAAGPNSLPVHKWNPLINPPGVNANPTIGAVDATTTADPIEVSYNFQMNRPNDVIKVDYLTRELMTVGLQARLYDPASSRPQIIDLSNKIKIRNLQR